MGHTARARHASMGADVDTVGVDNAHRFALATEHLIDQGHTRIAFAGNRKGYTVANQRRQGYLSAMNKHGLPVNDGWVIDVELTPTDGRNAVRAISDRKPRRTAVVCYNDQVAFGMLRELDRMGKRARKALAVVGCDNVIAAEHTNPRLTTLSAGANKRGTMARRTLLARLEETEEQAEPPVQYFAEPEFVVRESSIWTAGPMRRVARLERSFSGQRCAARRAAQQLRFQNRASWAVLMSIRSMRNAR